MSSAGWRRSNERAPRRLHLLGVLDATAPPMIRLALSAVAAQLADLGTASPFHEVNALVLRLGTAAPFAKLAVLGLAIVAAFLVSRTRYRVVGGVVLVAAVVVGIVGALSNVTA